MTSVAQDWMLVGRVVGPFGVRGEMKVALYTDFPERFKGLGRVYFGPERRPMEVERARPHKGQVLLKLAGVEGPEAVSALRDLDVFVPRNEAVCLPEGHYYLDDLVGIEAYSEEGRSLGRISEVLRTGSNDVFVINKGRQALLVPAIKDAVRELDLDRRCLTVAAWVIEPEG
jgi:16S rRNA processing protein RimM